VHAGERADALGEVPVQVAAVGELEEREDAGDARGRRGERDLGVLGEGARDIA
jgi:hypothetical protein